MSDVHSELTVTEAALIDLQKGREALARRAHILLWSSLSGLVGSHQRVIY